MRRIKGFHGGIFMFALVVAMVFAVDEVGATSKESYKILGCPVTVDGVGVRSTSWTAFPLDDVLATAFVPFNAKTKRVGPVCQIVPQAGDQKDTFDLVTTYDATDLRPRWYQWSDAEKTWKSLETVMNRSNRSVRATVVKEGGVFGVFVDATETYTGKASWYRDKRYARGGATNIFPLGTLVRVTNTDNGKSVIVKIVSTWANSHPGRLIDLTSTAFQEIGVLSQGLVPISLERVVDTAPVAKP